MALMKTRLPQPLFEQDLLFSDLTFVQSSNNQAVGIAQNHCSGNSITDNTASSNGGEGITVDNQSNGGQVCMHTSPVLTISKADYCLVA